MIDEQLRPEGSIAVRISKRGKAYLKTARTLLRAAQTMTASAMAVSSRSLPTTTNGELRKLRNHQTHKYIELNG